jgi:hypothetical protein
MRIFQIEGSERSPWVWLGEKSGILEISGVSAFHNPFQFYRCLARWIHAFNLGPYKTRMVNMKFEYLDEDSVRGMEYMLLQLYKLGKENSELIINWYYSKENSLVLRVGLQYSGRSSIPFYLVAA